MRSFIRRTIVPALCLPALASAFNPISLVPGWNLVGNSDGTPIDVITKFGGAQILTVWKWNPAKGTWAFFTPLMSGTALTAYAQNKGYDVLTSVESKEGFWVNANAATVITDPLAPPPGTGAVQLSPTDLSLGWNLVASADKKTPAQLNNALAGSLNAASKGINTLWAWDVSSAGWRFYSSALDAQGGSVLADYITSKGYRPFTAPLSVTDGFWVNIAAATPTPPAPGASLNALAFSSASDWYLRVNTSTAAQNTPDANGMVRYSERRTARTGGGTPYSWGAGGGPWRGSDLHWNGSIWRTCPINFDYVQTVRDAGGTSSYNYCDALETGSNTRLPADDISDRPMIDVYNEIIAAGKTNLNIVAAPAVLGSATFPAGSLRYYQYGAPVTEAVGYYPGDGNRVTLADTALASGSVAACNATNQSASTLASNLDDLVSVNKGTPCVFGVSTVTGANGVTLSSGPRNESWGNTTLDMGLIGTSPVYSNASSATSFYTTNTRFRVGFGAGTVANYYSCQQRWDGSSRNCDLIGSGTYAIQTVGDGRTLSFGGLPALISSPGWNRVFVERGGFVYYGYRYLPLMNEAARLNLTGLNALFGQLGLPTVDPSTSVALSVTSYAGTYRGTISGSDTGTFVASISASGAQNCSGSMASTGAFACTFNLTPVVTDTTKANISITITGSAATLTGTVDFYTGAISHGTWVNGAASGSFAGNRQ